MGVIAMDNDETIENGRKIKPKSKAVAVLYDQHSESAPRIGAGGSGFIADQIIKIARENNVPFYKDDDLCEVLLQFEPDVIIPEELYEAVAKILVFIYRANKEKKF